MDVQSHMNLLNRKNWKQKRKTKKKKRTHISFNKMDSHLQEEIVNQEKDWTLFALVISAFDLWKSKTPVWMPKTSMILLV